MSTEDELRDDKGLREYQKQMREKVERKQERRFEFLGEHPGLRNGKSRKENDKARAKLLEDYRIDYDLPKPKCISDQILLYLRYGMDNLITFNAYQEPEMNFLGTKGVEEVMNMYYTLRGLPEVTNKRPLNIAMGILYIACLFYLKHGITQPEMGNIFTTNGPAVRNAFVVVYKLLQENGYKLPEKKQHNNKYYDNN